MLFPIFVAFTIWAFATSLVRGPREGFWRAWLVAMLLIPVWLIKVMGSVSIDVRTIAAGVGIGGFLLTTREKLRYRFAWMDALVFAMILTHVISAWSNNEVALMTIPEIMRRWLLPYIVGRLFVSSADDFSQFLPCVARLLLILSISAVLEAVTQINPLCELLGKTYPVLESGEGYRWGLKRAQGPLDHPIFFGLVLVMVSPFAIEAAQRGWQGRGPKWWIVLPFTMFAAVVSTVSRGPIAAALATAFATVTFRVPRLRPLLIGVALAGGCIAVVAKEQILEIVTNTVESDDFERWVEIDGEEYRYTGTAHRRLLLLAYREPIEECPFFGYGERLQGVTIAEHLSDRFSSFDNHYLLLYLQRGLAGLALFIGITLLAVWYLAKVAWNTRQPHSVIAGSLAGALLSVSALLSSVWFAPDHGTVWLFSVGLATCMSTLDSVPLNGFVKQHGQNRSQKGTVTPRSIGPTTGELATVRRLTPGHAPVRESPSIDRTKDRSERPHVAQP